MTLSFAEPRKEDRDLPGPYELLLGIDATLRLTSRDGRIVYEEVLFPIVELAVALEDWLASGLGAGQDFSFDSMESDEPGLVWCRARGDGWNVGALDEESPDLTIYDNEEVAVLFGRYVQGVDDWLRLALDRSLKDARV